MFFKNKNKNKRKKISEDEVMMMEWERLQKKGKKRYVWVDGVLKFGILLPIGFVLIDVLIGDDIYPTTGEMFRKLIIDIISFSVISFFYTRGHWNTLDNWKIKKDLEKKVFEELDSKIDFCYYCGSEIGEKDICPQCGKKLEL